MSNTCVFCGLNIVKTWEGTVNNLECKNCGKYKITDKMLLAMPHYLENELKDQKHIISGYLREMTELGIPTIPITSENFLSIVDSSRVPKTIMEKLDKLLLYLYKKSEYLYQEIIIDESEPAIAYAKNQFEYSKMITALESMGFIKTTNQFKPFQYIVTVSGIQRAESLDREGLHNDQVFVAMWFSDYMLDVFNDYISKGIEDAGYKPLIIPMKEHNDNITDQIIAEIRKSKFVVADFSGNRGGVYFEAGFAFGLNKKVIWTCNEDWFNNEVLISQEALVDGDWKQAKIKEVRNVHFDVNHYNFIVWQDGEELREKLKNRILATIPKERI